MKRILITTVLLLNSLLPSVAFASSSPAKFPEVSQSLISEVKNGNKVDLLNTVPGGNSQSDRYVVFVKENKYESERKAVAQLGGVYTNEDGNTYGKVKAVPIDISYMSEVNETKFLKEVNERSSVIAISPVQKRELNSVPSFNDPLYPSDLSYNSAKQWYLSQPTGSFIGIDAARAWQTLDNSGFNYNGDSNLIIAVIDTGVNFENYSKYDQFEKMTSAIPWVFTKGSDSTSNLYLNTDETSENQIDDDNNADPDFCLDKNANGNCDSGELASYIDDRNGVNIVDWGKYWSRVNYSEYAAAPVCANEPYNSDEVKCVVESQSDSVCNINGLSNFDYYGCFESEMGHPNDTHGHGTLVSNIISATPNNGVSGVGIASGVKILPIKVFGEFYNSYRSAWEYDSAYGDQIASAINYAVDAGAKIINMSFAGSSVDLYEKMAMDKAYYEDGVLLVASSGNSASATTMYPAGYESVLSVGSSTKTGARASYSSYGSTLDLVAPVDTGIITQGMWDTANNRSITTPCSWDSSSSCMNVNPLATPSQFSTVSNLTVSGTSFAAPQVVSVAALIMTQYPNLTASQVMYILKMSSLPNGSATFSTSIGHGIVNAYNSVNAKDYRGVELGKVRRMYQTQLSSTGYVQTRYSDTFGASWSSWIQSGSVKSVGNIITLNVPTVNSRIVQFMKGTNSGVYFRYSNNYGYLAQDDSQWSGWVSLGNTSGYLSLVSTDTNLVAAWEGTDGKVYTKYSTDGVTWNSVAPSTKLVSGNIPMIVDSATNKVLQIVRSNSNYLYTRTSTDRGQTWSSWNQSYDVVIADPYLAYIDGRIIRTVRVKDNVIVTRVSNDGGSTWGPRNRTYGTSGLAVSTVSITESPTNNVVIQSYRTKLGDIYSRNSTNNGDTWGNQTIGIDIPGSVKAITNPSTVVAGVNIIQMVRGSDNYIYYRKSSNGGTTWGGWRNKGSIKTLGNIVLKYESEIQRIFVSARDLNGRVYTRYSDDFGGNYSAWISGSISPTGLSNYSVETASLDLSN